MNRRRPDYLTFSLDNQILIVPADDDEIKQTVLRVISVASGKVERTITIGCEVKAQLGLELSADGRRLAAEWVENQADGRPANPNDRTTSHVVWDLANGQELLRIAAHRGGNRASSLSADGAMLGVTVVEKGQAMIRMWDVDSGQIRRDIPVAALVTGLAFGPSGRGILALTANRDPARTATGTAYDTTTGEILASVRGVFGTAYRIAFSPDGRRLAIAAVIQENQTGEVKVWDLESQRELMTLPLPELFPRSLHFSPDGNKLIVLGGRTGVTIWDGTPLPD